MTHWVANEQIKELNKKYKISESGEGGEFESLVLNCPMFKNKIKVLDFIEKGEKNSWRMVVMLK